MIFTQIECYKCGIIFGVTPTLDKNWQRDKTQFYCPNGHGQSYIKSTAEQLQELLNKKETELQEKNQEIQRLMKTPKKIIKRKKDK